MLCNDSVYVGIAQYILVCAWYIMLYSIYQYIAIYCAVLLDKFHPELC
jgi:hypothetical protein